MENEGGLFLLTTKELEENVMETINSQLHKKVLYFTNLHRQLKGKQQLQYIWQTISEFPLYMKAGVNQEMTPLHIWKKSLQKM